MAGRKRRSLGESAPKRYAGVAEKILRAGEPATGHLIPGLLADGAQCRTNQAFWQVAAGMKSDRLAPGFFAAWPIRSRCSCLGRILPAAFAPLKRNVTTEDVGNAAAFLCSDLAAGITGETLYVDSGYSHVGMSFPE